MNFEIQKRALSRVIRDDLDALIVFWPAAGTSPADKDPVSTLVASAVKHGDLELKAGSLVSVYAHIDIKARHLVCDKTAIVNFKNHLRYR